MSYLSSCCSSFPLAVFHPTDVEDVQIQHQDLFHLLFCQSSLYMIVTCSDNLQSNTEHEQ